MQTRTDKRLETVLADAMNLYFGEFFEWLYKVIWDFDFALNSREFSNKKWQLFCSKMLTQFNNFYNQCLNN